MDEQLALAEELADNGQLDEAHDIVTAIVEADKTNFDAWSALVELAHTDLERRTAIYKMWGLRPDDPDANLLLDKLKAGTLPPLNNPHYDFSSRKHHSNRRKYVSKDFSGHAMFVTGMYIFFWIFGLVLNIYYLSEAHKAEQAREVIPENVGCLWATLAVGSIYTVVIFLAILSAIW